MLGAIIGDIAGSRFEHRRIKQKEFDFFHEGCRLTDDSVMTLAVADAILACSGDFSALSAAAVRSMQTLGRRYPAAGYGWHFSDWLETDDPEPYNSFGNGAGMRVSPCAQAAKSMEEALAMSDAVTAVSHDHPEGMKGARAITAAIFLARTSADKAAIREHILKNYYAIDFTLDEIRPTYRFDVTCQGSVPQALESFFESDSFEDAIRNAVSLGGDSDTIGAMAGSIAEAYYGIPDALREGALGYMDVYQRNILRRFEQHYPLPARG